MIQMEGIRVRFDAAAHRLGEVPVEEVWWTATRILTDEEGSKTYSEAGAFTSTLLTGLDGKKARNAGSSVDGNRASECVFDRPLMS